MNALTQIKSMKVSATQAPVKARLFRICYVVATAVAMVGWLSAIGWGTVAAAKWLLA